jgi:uncharacterized Zn-finger protein
VTIQGENGITLEGKNEILRGVHPVICTSVDSSFHPLTHGSVFLAGDAE